MGPGWDGFARRRREVFWAPLCALWDHAVRILRSHFNGMGWAQLGCMWDGDGTGSWDAFHQWGPQGNPQKTEMGWDGMILMCHTVGGRRWDCVIGNVGLYVRSGTGHHVPNNQCTWYTIIICRLLSYSVFSKDEGLHQTNAQCPRT